MNSSENASCQQLFKELNILPIQSQYIFSVLLLLNIKTNFCLTHKYIKSVQGKLTICTYLHTANLVIYQNGVYYSGIMIYTHLPTAIKDLSGDKNKFKLALKRYLLHNSFFSLEEYFNT